ncbi:glycerophosphodiester phosphodiesterase [Halioglobus maricola]|uniref:glycerophosphodiester phosphodiesterase n=1 Tax=Halioglobus maricola TaxID=2601894 RepID=UPI001478D238|nr:glycerophosphodiester phosphodiesterase family protein [Halioglobus maricola]
MKERLQSLAMGLVDSTVAVLPRAVPSDAALRNCKIISHRGEHDNTTVLENTAKAFALARSAGVWGIECDIRWTRDNVPIICHDEDTERVFGQKRVIVETSFEQLRREFPDIPTLAELIDAFAPACHLMLEIKAFNPECLTQQQDILKSQLARLQPGRDYHFLALDPDLFDLVSFCPPAALLPVAETNVAALSQISLERGYCGLAGHFLLLGRQVQQRHEAAGQRIGVGFPRSRNSLFRELGRPVEWIFSNDAVKLQSILDQYCPKA